jgi:O-antigen/teichoic acid export membrane protein
MQILIGKKINQLKAGAVLSYVSMGLGYLISLIYTPIMLRLLGRSEYGLYNLVAAVVAYLGLLNFGFSSAYMRYYSKFKVNDDEENIARLNGMFLLVFSLIGLIALVAGSFFVLYVDLILGDKLTLNELSRAQILMAIMVFNIALSFPATVFNVHIVANEEYIFLKLMQMIKVVFNPLLVLPVLFLGYGSIGMVAMITISNIAVEVSNTVFCFRILKIRFNFRNFDFTLMREMIIFSSYIFINMIVDQVNWSVDRFILGRFHGTVAVALYGLAAQINIYYMSLSSAISNVFVPRIHRLVAKTDDNLELSGLFTRVGRIQFILLSMICSGFILFGRPFLNLWAGSDYDDAYYILLILIVPVTIPLIQILGIYIQRAKNMHKFRSWTYLFIAIANIGISIPLARQYSGIGAALGTGFALLIGNGLIMNWYNHFKVGLDMKYFWIQIFKIALALTPAFLIGILINLYVDLYRLPLLIIFGSAYVVLFSLSMWFLGMNKYEKDLIGKPVLKTFLKIKSHWE